MTTQDKLELHYRLSIARQLGIYLTDKRLREEVKDRLNLTDEALDGFLQGTRDIKISEIAEIEAIILEPILLTPFQIDYFVEDFTEGHGYKIFYIDEYKKNLYEFLEVSKDIKLSMEEKIKKKILA